MLVFGDRSRRVDPAVVWTEIVAGLRTLEERPPGIETHGRLVGLLIDAGMLAQGLADAAMVETGEDGLETAPSALTRLITGLAEAIARSWRAGFKSPAIVQTASAGALPSAVTLKTPEGYAFYAVYPEAYLAAASAATWNEPPTVIGLRSIGASLGPIVGTATGASRILSLRPVGPPFSRGFRLSTELHQALLTEPAAPYVLVDEGPGLSGSSLCGLVELLAGRGVGLDRIIVMPSHDGAPGPQASQSHRELWARVRRVPASFERLQAAASAPTRMEAWFADLVGPAVAPLEDLSGGAWRGRSAGAGLPAAPAQERRKYLHRTEAGDWLLKFAGLGRAGEETFADAVALAEAGFSPRPLALRHGFTIEPWLARATPLDATTLNRTGILEYLGRYLAFRARRMPAGRDAGASLEALAEMARVNLTELLGPESGAALLRPPPSRPGPRIRTDSRLHVWEWLRLPDGRLLKTDAVDHCRAHDLVGCQEVDWDLAGAAVELRLMAEEQCVLRRAVGLQPDPQRSAFFRVAYCAFQAGLWSLAGEDAQVDRYLASLR